MREALLNLQNYENTWQQLVAIFVSSMTPFVESYFGAAIGIILGFSFFVAVPVAIAGNAISMVATVMFGHKISEWRVKRAERLGKTMERSSKSLRLESLFHKWGIPGVSLLGQTLLPSQITSMAMVSLGAPRKKVIIWQLISIALWGVIFGALTHWGIQLL